MEDGKDQHAEAAAAAAEKTSEGGQAPEPTTSNNGGTSPFMLSADVTSETMVPATPTLAITPTKHRIIGSTCNTPSGSSFTSLPVMREQDADLLESMHYAASQVSQYSPGGTPILRPTDRSLPIEDLNLTLTPMAVSLEQMLLGTEDGGNHHQELNNGVQPVNVEAEVSVIDKANSDDDWDDAGGDEGDGDTTNTKSPHRTSSLRTNFTSEGENAPSRQSSGGAFFRSVTFSTERDKDGNGGDDHRHEAQPPQQQPSRTSVASMSGLTQSSSMNSENGDCPLDALRVPELSGSSISQTTTAFQSNPQVPVGQPSPQSKRPSFRRLLSGDVTTVQLPDDGQSVADQSATSRREEDTSTQNGTNQRMDDRHHHEIHTTMSGEEMIDGNPVIAAPAEDEEETTTDSPLSVLQEAEKAKAREDSGLAERRRVNEAIQFAQAVGEDISIHRNDLRIIEDNEEEDDDDDDDEAIEAKEVVAMPSSSLHQYDDRSLPHHGPELLDSRSNTDNVNDVSLVDAGVEPRDAHTLLPRTVDIRHTSSHGIHHRRKSRPVWPFEQPAESETFIEHLSDGPADRTNFVYHGIKSNPPEITKRGIQRGNYAQLHRKAWLEVSDKYHRYGKNLRLYYRFWERLGFPTNKFFDWLDSKGEAAGQPLPNLDECPRSVLDSDTVLYITNPDVTDGYALDIGPSGEDGRGRVVDVDSDSVLTGKDGWIFVLRDNIMYGAPKITSISGHSKQRFHHSSFFSGKAVASAGIIITDDEGNLTRLYPHSGHYRPSESHMQRMLLFLHRKGVDLRTFEVDTQQLSHLSREKETKPKDKKSKGKEDGDATAGNGTKKEKAKKVDSLHLEKAIDVACYLSHKADFIGKGIFNKIHQIRRADVTSVTEALNLVDNGGYWKQRRR